MGYLDNALGDSGCSYLGAYERRTYTDAWTVKEVQANLADLADKARRGKLPREEIAFDPGPIDGVIRQSLTDAIIAAQKYGQHAATDGKIDDWLLSALGMQPHAKVDEGKPPATEIPNPAKQKPANSGSSSKPKTPASAPSPPKGPSSTPEASGMSTPAKVGLALGAAALVALATRKKRTS